MSEDNDCQLFNVSTDSILNNVMFLDHDEKKIHLIVEGDSDTATLVRPIIKSLGLEPDSFSVSSVNGRERVIEACLEGKERGYQRVCYMADRDYFRYVDDFQLSRLGQEDHSALYNFVQSDSHDFFMDLFLQLSDQFAFYFDHKKRIPVYSDNNGVTNYDLSSSSLGDDLIDFTFELAGIISHFQILQLESRSKKKLKIYRSHINDLIDQSSQFDRLQKLNTIYDVGVSSNVEISKSRWKSDEPFHDAILRIGDHDLQFILKRVAKQKFGIAVSEDELVTHVSLWGSEADLSRFGWYGILDKILQVANR